MMPPMTTISFGTVVLAEFPYVEHKGITKARPGVVISNDEFHLLRGDVVVVAVTTKLDVRKEIEPVLHDWREAGLRKPSALKAAIATVRLIDLKAVLGHLSKEDRMSLKHFLSQALGDNP